MNFQALEAHDQCHPGDSTGHGPGAEGPLALQIALAGRPQVGGGYR